MSAVDAAHRHEVRVYYEDTDAGGIVYHAAYLRFAERARTELLRAAGWGHRGLRERTGGLLVATACSIRFMAPARLDDLLTVLTWLIDAGGARIALRQEVRLEQRAVARLEVELAFIGGDLRPRRLPEELRAALAPTLPRGEGAAAEAPARAPAVAESARELGLTLRGKALSV